MAVLAALLEQPLLRLLLGMLLAVLLVVVDLLVVADLAALPERPLLDVAQRDRA